MKQHPFFSSIHWAHLEKKLITPPVFLTMDEEDERKVESDDDEETKFLSFSDDKSPTGKSAN